ncbi:hypothetical protein FEDK69T_05320 [Flavobacterium enshiense DK69]|uniref:hypothetical protein n=1 Tax=Flavobacterium enshiense TaxID=1341165 RepID=UPI0003C59F0E|nr:hypothetical protein [Flavobacterium enshiense]ESU24611.1 hypothetical protein FEDK69T_05320 [Flavobacterium enshiense DK69]
MKGITLLAALSLTIASCNCQKKAAEQSNATEMKTTDQQNVMPVIEYTANSRGFFLFVRAENHKLYISRNRDENKMSLPATPVSDTDWKEIEKLAKAVNLQTVNDLKWPTEKRFYDGAAHANITFLVDSNRYETKGFDHGYPPVEIEKLVNKIVTLAENKQ